MDEQKMKAAVKEGIKEWLDEKYLAFGKWSAGAFMAALFGAVMYFVLTHSGWTHK